MPQAKIYLNGAIGYDWWTGVDNTSERFINDFNAALNNTAVDEIAIHINSMGGDVHEGLAIFNTIRNAEKATKTVIDGIAYSMGAVIALAADQVTIASNGLFMLHNASGMDWGNARQFRTTAGVLDKYDNQLAVSVAEKTGQALEDVKSMWFNYEDNFFTAQEAKDAGLVDQVLDDAADLPDEFDAQGPPMKIAAQLSMHLKPREKSWFNRLVTRVKDELTIETTSQTIDPPPTNSDEMKIKNSLTQLLAFFKAEPAQDAEDVTLTPTDEQLEALNAELENAGKVSTLQDQVSNLTTERDNLKAEVDRLGKLTGQAPTPPSADPDPDPAAKPKYSWEIEREEMLARRKK